jgi:hypothetical protein
MAPEYELYTAPLNADVQADCHMRKRLEPTNFRSQRHGPLKDETRACQQCHIGPGMAQKQVSIRTGLFLARSVAGYATAVTAKPLKAYKAQAEGKPMIKIYNQAKDLH